MRYQLSSEAVTAGAPAGAPDPAAGPLADSSNTRRRESHTRSVAKAVSWRVTGTIDTFVVSLFVTGRLGIAGSIAATEFLTKIALYYGHERIWAMVRWGGD